MFTYLGSTGNPEQYRELLKDKLKENDNNKIEMFNIEIDKGIFEAYPAKLDNNEGYIYCVNQYDTYEFCTEDEIKNKKLKEEVIIATPKKIDNNLLRESIFNERNNDTKEVEEHQITYYNFKGYKSSTLAQKAKLNGIEGFVYQNKEWSSRFQKHTNTHYFIDKKSINSNKFISNKKIYNELELKAIAKAKLKEEYDITKKIFQERKIEIKNYPDFDTYESKGRYMVSRLINKLKVLEKNYGIKVENKKVDFQKLDNDLDEIIYNKKLDIAKKDMLKEYGFTIEAFVNEKDEVTINILGKNNKKLSSLKTNNFTHTEDYEIDIKSGEWDEVVGQEEIEISYGYIDIEDIMYTKGKTISIIENNKEKELEDSKFYRVYEMLDKICFTKDEDLANQDEFENKEDILLEVYNIDIENKLSFINVIKKEIEKDPELKKCIEILNKNTTKRNNKI